MNEASEVLVVEADAAVADGAAAVAAERGHVASTTADWSGVATVEELEAFTVVIVADANVAKVSEAVIADCSKAGVV